MQDKSEQRCGNPQLAPDAVLLGDDLEAPDAVQANIGLSYRLGMSGLVLEADATWVEGRGELVYRDTNWAGNACVDDPMVSCRPIPGFTKIDRYTSEGHSRSKALTVGVSGALHGGHLMNAAVIVSDKKSIMDDALTLHKLSDCADVEAEWGRSNTDERYRVVLSGVFLLPWELTLAPIYEYGNGRPWTRLLGYDYNGDGSVTDRPPDSERNDRDGPRFQQLSLRLTKAVPLGGKGRLDLIVEAFNVFNTTNYDVNSVDNAMNLSRWEENPRFGAYTATLSPAGDPARCAVRFLRRQSEPFAKRVVPRMGWDRDVRVDAVGGDQRILPLCSLLETIEGLLDLAPNKVQPSQDGR